MEFVTVTLPLRGIVVVVGLLASLAVGLLLGATLIRQKTVITVTGPPKVVTVTMTVAPQPDPVAVAESDVRAAVPSAEAYYADHGYYTGMNADALRAIDYGLSPRIVVANATASTYCLEASVSSATAFFSAPGGVVGTGPC